MRPPICYVCGKDLEDETDGGLVSFALIDSDKDWLKRAQAEPGFVGHPPWQEWYCRDHIGPYKKYSHLTRSGALELVEREQ